MGRSRSCVMARWVGTSNAVTATVPSVAMTIAIRTWDLLRTMGLLTVT